MLQEGHGSVWLLWRLGRWREKRTLKCVYVWEERRRVEESGGACARDVSEITCSSWDRRPAWDHQRKRSGVCRAAFQAGKVRAKGREVPKDLGWWQMWHQVVNIRPQAPNLWGVQYGANAPQQLTWLGWFPLGEAELRKLGPWEHKVWPSQGRPSAAPQQWALPLPPGTAPHKQHPQLGVQSQGLLSHPKATKPWNADLVQTPCASQ